MLFKNLRVSPADQFDVRIQKKRRPDLKKNHCVFLESKRLFLSHPAFFSLNFQNSIEECCAEHGKSSTGPSGGNQVEGLPPASSSDVRTN